MESRWLHYSLSSTPSCSWNSECSSLSTLGWCSLPHTSKVWTRQGIPFFDVFDVTHHSRNAQYVICKHLVLNRNFVSYIHFKPEKGRSMSGCCLVQGLLGFCIFFSLSIFPRFFSKCINSNNVNFYSTSCSVPYLSLHPGYLYRYGHCYQVTIPVLHYSWLYQLFTAN